tara:strand:+ start:13 stop:519 length:507 start_codon:yes stop_codon:yes gene_type:complete
MGAKWNSIAAKIAFLLFLFCVVIGCSISPDRRLGDKNPIWNSSIGYRVGSGEPGGSVSISLGVQFPADKYQSISQYLEPSDQEMAQLVFQFALESNRTDTAASWVNPVTKHSGRITPTRTYIASDGTPCRTFKTFINVGGNETQGYGRFLRDVGTACRNDDGIWEVVR